MAAAGQRSRRKSAKSALGDTLNLYKDAGECAISGVIGGLRGNAVDPFTPKTVFDSEVGGIICGAAKR